MEATESNRQRSHSRRQIPTHFSLWGRIRSVAIILLAMTPGLLGITCLQDSRRLRGWFNETAAHEVVRQEIDLSRVGPIEVVVPPDRLSHHGSDFYLHFNPAVDSLAEAQARLAGFKGSLAQDNAEPDAVAGHELLADSPRSGRLYPRVPGHYIDLRGPSLDTGAKLTLEVIEPATAPANQKTFVTVHRCPCPNVLIRCAALSFFGWAGIVVSAIILLALGRLYLLWRQGATDTA